MQRLFSPFTICVYLFSSTIALASDSQDASKRIGNPCYYGPPNYNLYPYYPLYANPSQVHFPHFRSGSNVNSSTSNPQTNQVSRDQRNSRNTATSAVAQPTINQTLEFKIDKKHILPSDRVNSYEDKIKRLVDSDSKELFCASMKDLFSKQELEDFYTIGSASIDLLVNVLKNPNTKDEPSKVVTSAWRNLSNIKSNEAFTTILVRHIINNIEVVCSMRDFSGLTVSSIISTLSKLAVHNDSVRPNIIKSLDNPNIKNAFIDALEKAGGNLSINLIPYAKYIEFKIPESIQSRYAEFLFKQIEKRSLLLKDFEYICNAIDAMDYQEKKRDLYVKLKNQLCEKINNRDIIKPTKIDMEAFRNVPLFDGFYFKKLKNDLPSILNNESAPTPFQAPRIANPSVTKGKPSSSPGVNMIPSINPAIVNKLSNRIRNSNNEGYMTETLTMFKESADKNELDSLGYFRLLTNLDLKVEDSSMRHVIKTFFLENQAFGNKITSLMLENNFNSIDTSKATFLMFLRILSDLNIKVENQFINRYLSIFDNENYRGIHKMIHAFYLSISLDCIPSTIEVPMGIKNKINAIENTVSVYQPFFTEPIEELEKIASSKPLGPLAKKWYELINQIISTKANSVKKWDTINIEEQIYPSIVVDNKAVRFNLYGGHEPTYWKSLPISFMIPDHLKVAELQKVAPNKSQFTETMRDWVGFHDEIFSSSEAYFYSNAIIGKINEFLLGMAHKITNYSDKEIKMVMRVLRSLKFNAGSKATKLFSESLLSKICTIIGQKELSKDIHYIIISLCHIGIKFQKHALGTKILENFNSIVAYYNNEETIKSLPSFLESLAYQNLEIQESHVREIRGILNLLIQTYMREEHFGEKEAMNLYMFNAFNNFLTLRGIQKIDLPLALSDKWIAILKVQNFTNSQEAYVLKLLKKINKPSENSYGSIYGETLFKPASLFLDYGIPKIKLFIEFDDPRHFFRNGGIGLKDKFKMKVLAHYGHKVAHIPFYVAESFKNKHDNLDKYYMKYLKYLIEANKG